MKKSNKILLGGFLTVILLIAGIHIALFAKYKSGNYTIYHPEDKRADGRMKSFSNVSFVIIRNVGNASIQFGARAEVEKTKEDVVQYVQKADSLIITGDDYSDRPDGRRPVNFTLPYNATLSAVNSFLYFEKGKSDGEYNTVINLQRSRVTFSESAGPFLLGHIKVAASESSIVTFHGNMQVNNFEVQLSNSALEFNEGNAGQLSIVTDSLSRLSLQSKLLLKAKITTTPDNP
jgi:hypothetical protein